MDSEKPGKTIKIHPNDPGLKYLEMGEKRKMTRSQARYREYIKSEHPDSFADYLGIKKS